MLSLFIIATAEGWIEIMNDGVDSVGIGKEPIMENSPGWCVFFVIFILIGSFFILNLLVGVIIDSFNKEENLEMGTAFLDET